jgi:hypothetical protein
LGRGTIRVEEILNLAESPQRLPARFANELYLRGETGMGYFAFSAHFYSGLSRHYVGGCVDFIDYPPLMSPGWIRSITVGGRDRRYSQCLDFQTCIFAE